LRRRRRDTRVAWFIALCVPCASAAEPSPGVSSSEIASEKPTEAQVHTDEAEFIVLNYQAPPGCPDRPLFEELVRTLTPAAHFKTPGSVPGSDRNRIPEKAPRKMTITISQRSSDFFGTLELVDEQALARRQFDADTCQEIVEALALATALAIDPQALGGATKPAPTPETPQADETSGNQDAPTLSEEPDAQEKKRVELTLGVRGSFQALRITERSLESATRLASTQMKVWEAAPTLELYIDWTTAMGSSVNASLGFAVARSSEVDFKWLPVGRWGLCPVWWKVSDAFRLGVCGGIQVGRLESTPSPAILSAQDATRTYLSADAGPSAQVRWGRLRLIAGGGAVTPLIERSYVLATAAGEDEVLMTLHNKPGAELHVSAQWELF
jgi:hypothetical protein